MPTAVVRSARPAPGSSPPRPPRRWKRWIVPLVVAAVVGAGVGVGVAAAIRVPNVEEIARFSPKLVTRLVDTEGRTVATYARERRLLLREGELPEQLQNAILAAEDSQFFVHGGVDLFGVVRSVLVNYQRGRRAQGASTITMQLARQLMGRREKTWERKITETLLAVELEKRLSKQQILTLYSNLAFLGHGNYGMEAAARDYFGRGVAELSLAEAATLAGIVQRPSDFNPYRQPDRVVARRNYVLRRMVEEGYIDRATCDAAVLEPLTLTRQRPPRELGAYFTEAVRRRLEETYGDERLYSDGFQVRTTLDARIQTAAELALREGLLRLDHRRGWRGPLERGLSTELLPDEIEQRAGRNPVPDEWVAGLVVAVDPVAAVVRSATGEGRLERDGVRWTGRADVDDVLRVGDLVWVRTETDDNGQVRWRLEQEPEIEGAVLVLESASGAVRGLVGGWDFKRSKFDRALQAERQVGSAFKPFVYGAAFESGFTPADRVFDAPVSFLGADGQLSYSPRNYYRRYSGIMTLRRALEQSINVPAVKLLDMVGAQHVIDFARRSGITSALPPYPSLALGSADLLPIELASAYGAIANQGVLVRPYLIEEVRQPDGTVLEAHQVEAAKAMEPAIAYLLTRTMEGVIDRGTAGRLADLPLAIAGKTGTTNDYTDAWFVGFTPRYTILTWIGRDQKKPIGNKMTGAEAALPIWRRIAELGLEAGWLTADEPFPVPAGIELRAIDRDTGLLAAPGAPRVIQEAFLLGTAPAEVWQPRQATIQSLPWPQQVAFYRPRPNERMPGDFAPPPDFFADRGEEAGD